MSWCETVPTTFLFLEKYLQHQQVTDFTAAQLTRLDRYQPHVWETEKLASSRYLESDIQDV